MNVFTHEEYLKELKRKAQRLQWGAIALFVVSVACTFSYTIEPLFVYLAYPFLLGFLALWTLSRNQQRRLSANPRIDQVIAGELKGLNNKYTLHNYVKVGAQVIKHLLVTPTGLLVMESSDAAGPVRCKGDKWKSDSNWLDRLTGLKPPIGNPSADLNLEVDAAKQLLAGIGKQAVPVKGMVVFVKNPELFIDECAYEAIPLEELKQAVRDAQVAMGGEREEGPNVASILTNDDRRRLNTTLSPQPAPTAAKAVSAGARK